MPEVDDYINTEAVNDGRKTPPMREEDDYINTEAINDGRKTPWKVALEQLAGWLVSKKFRQEMEKVQSQIAMAHSAFPLAMDQVLAWQAKVIASWLEVHNTEPLSFEKQMRLSALVTQESLSNMDKDLLLIQQKIEKAWLEYWLKALGADIQAILTQPVSQWEQSDIFTVSSLINRWVQNFKLYTSGLSQIPWEDQWTLEQVQWRNIVSYLNKHADACEEILINYYHTRSQDTNYWNDTRTAILIEWIEKHALLKLHQNNDIDPLIADISKELSLMGIKLSQPLKWIKVEHITKIGDISIPMDVISVADAYDEVHVRLLELFEQCKGEIDICNTGERKYWYILAHACISTEKQINKWLEEWKKSRY